MTDRITVKEKVIIESIKRCEKRIVKLKAILESDPLGELIQLRSEFSKKLKEVKDWSDPEASVWLDKSVEVEKRLTKQIKYQNKNYSKFTQEQFQLEYELNQYRSEKYFIDQRNGK